MSVSKTGNPYAKQLIYEITDILVNQMWQQLQMVILNKERETCIGGFRHIDMLLDFSRIVAYNISN